jgi:hypothetical protein
MRTARGAVSLGMGVGLEKAMDYVWDEVWSGKIPFFDKYKFGEGMADNMNSFALKNDINARLYYLLKEGTQDFSIAAMYNYMAFRTQPLLPKVEAKHLLGSLSADVLEAAFAPNLPRETQQQALASKKNIVSGQIDRIEEKVIDLSMRGRGRKEGDQNIFSEQIEALKEQSRKKKEYIDSFFSILDPTPTPVERVTRSILSFSNPVSQLGADMMVGGVMTLIKNYGEVRKVRKEKGGLPGKKVFMPKEDTRRDFGDRKPYDNKREYGNKPKYNSKDKVYYGRATWNNIHEKEEYDLKMDT